MNSIKYVGLDVHQSTISVAVLDGDGKLVMQCVLATRAGAIVDFFAGLRGSIHVTFEEGSQAAWLYDLLVQRVAKLVVCNPRKNALLKAGNKSDTIDARKLAELLRAGLLSAVYQGQKARPRSSNWGAVMARSPKTPPASWAASRHCIAARRLLAPARSLTARAIAKTT